VSTVPDRDRAPDHVVVYVEDNLSNTRLMERIVAHRPGWLLAHTTFGAQAYDLVRRHRPALVLLDLHLPDLAGQDVLAELQADPTTAVCPVYVVSADATPSQKQRLRARGAAGYITKPIEVREILALLDSAALGAHPAR